MKKFTIIIVATIATINTFAASFIDNVTSSTQQEVILKKVPGLGQGYGRGITGVLYAYYHPILSQVEVVCHDEGIVSAYIINNEGQTCDLIEFDSSVINTVFLSVPDECGTYSLIVYSEATYAEGVVIK